MRAQLLGDEEGHGRAAAVLARLVACSREHAAANAESFALKRRVLADVTVGVESVGIDEGNHAGQVALVLELAQDGVGALFFVAPSRVLFLREAGLEVVNLDLQLPVPTLLILCSPTPDKRSSAHSLTRELTRSLRKTAHEST